jgi:hypothetical protein
MFMASTVVRMVSSMNTSKLIKLNTLNIYNFLYISHIIAIHKVIFIFETGSCCVDQATSNSILIPYQTLGLQLRDTVSSSKVVLKKILI